MNLKDKIMEWLIEEGFFKNEVHDENAEFHFVIEVPPSSGQTIDVIYPKNRNLVLVATGIKLSDEHYRMVMGMSEKERREFMWKIRFDLLFLNTEFQIIPGAESPQLFQFTRKLYPENLTRQLLIDSISEVHKCKLYIIWRMKEVSERHQKNNDAMYL